MAVQFRSSQQFLKSHFFVFVEALLISGQLSEGGGEI